MTDSSSLYSFLGASNPDPNSQANLNQYIQQGQNMINPGQAQVQASNPIGTAAGSNLAQALAKLGQQQPLPAQQFLPQQAAQMGLQGSAAMGQPGPTPQALALAQGLQPQPMNNNVQQFMNSGDSS